MDAKEYIIHVRIIYLRNIFLYPNLYPNLYPRLVKFPPKNIYWARNKIIYLCAYYKKDYGESDIHACDMLFFNQENGEHSLLFFTTHYLIQLLH